MTNLDSVLKIKGITLLTNIFLVKAMVFPIVMHGCESWTIKKAEHLRINALKLWYWRRLLRVPWTARRSNQSILKDSLEGLMLKLQSGHLIGRADSLEKTLMLGRTEGRRRGWQSKRWLDGITNSMDMSEKTLGDRGGQRKPACRSPWRCTDGHDLATEQQPSPEASHSPALTQPSALAHLPSSHREN